jgi:regulator of sigma E protease
VHEYGHYLAAKRVGVKITNFSLGMGPEIYGFNDKHGTRWSFSLLPIGGYVMMLGDGDVASATEDENALKTMSAEERTQSIFTKSNWEKMLIAFSGPFFNYVYAFAVLIAMAFFHGIPVYNTIIGGILKDSPAEKAGLTIGDKIISVNGSKVEKYQDIIMKIRDNETKSVNFVIERNCVTKEVSIIPELKETKRIIGGIKKNKVVGILSGSLIFERKSFSDAVKLAIQECVNATKGMCTIFKRLFAGKKSLDDFGGIVRMAEVAGDLSKSGNFALLIMFTVTLSINLGFINLFPFPVLDGGRILILFMEQVTGKKLNKTVQEYIIIACAALLIFLMLITTVNDVLRLECVNKFVSDFFG